MSTARAARTGPELEYPTSDGKPMAETPLHRDIMLDTIQTLEDWYAADPRVYVSGNMILCYVEGDPRRFVAPDVFVVRGVAKDRERENYLVWQERKGPDVVFEITSRTTAREDRRDKLPLYRDVLKVREYFLFDPRAEYLHPPLQGYRLVRGRYVPIQEVEGRLPSKVLGLHLERQGRRLRLYDPAVARPLLTRQERIEQAEAERQREAESREQAEAEVRRLRRELAKLSRRQAKRRRC